MFAPAPQPKKVFLTLETVRVGPGPVGSKWGRVGNMLVFVRGTRSFSMRISLASDRSKGPASIRTSPGENQIPKIYKNLHCGNFRSAGLGVS